MSAKDIATAEAISIASVRGVIGMAREAGYVIPCTPGRPLSTFVFLPPTK